MKARKLVDKSKLFFFRPGIYMNEKETRIARECYLWLNTVRPSTYESHHPSDPLLKMLRAQLVKPESRYLKFLNNLKYRMGYFHRKLCTPNIWCDIKPGVWQKPIRLINPDKVIGVFYERDNNLH